MSNKNLTDITLLLDRSGSMATVAADVVGGIDSFIREQMKTPGECNFTLVQFDSQDPFEVIYDAVPIAKAKAFTHDDFTPRAMTPLLDSMGASIGATRRRIKKMPKADRPGNVVFVVYTDGHENASREYTFQDISELVTKFEEKGWAFLYLGQGLDAFDQHQYVGTQSVHSVHTVSTKAGEAVRTMSGKISNYRMSGDVKDLQFNAVDRENLGKA